MLLVVSIVYINVTVRTALDGWMCLLLVGSDAHSFGYGLDKLITSDRAALWSSLVRL